MIQLRTVTEHSGRRALGTVQDLVALAKAQGHTAVALTDTTAFGHVEFERECLKQGVEPIFGLTREDGVVMLAIDSVEDLYAERWDRCAALLPWGRSIDEAGRRNVSNTYRMVDPTTPPGEVSNFTANLALMVAASRPSYVLASQAELHELSSGRVGRWHAGHLLSDAEFDALHPDLGVALRHSNSMLAYALTVHRQRLPRATAPRATETAEAFADLARQALRVRMTGREISFAYWNRLDHELAVVAEKGYQGYFEMVSELVLWAKSRGIRVGPGRGSACGSLLCWVLGITEIDPIPHGLLFERFLDPSRPDLPDVDLDFPEDRRDEVFAHLRRTYGEDRVARLGSTLRRGGKGALADGLRALRLPMTPELKAASEAAEVRLAGEEGEPTTLRDALDHCGVQDPEVRACCALEGLVSAHGKHAAGVVIAPDPLSRYVRVVDGVAEADLHDAEALGLVKLDCLGLRTLTVLDRACRLAGVDWQSLPMPEAVADEDLRPLREGRFAGVFQFEGAALQALSLSAPPDAFEDVALLTAVARPGPLQAGTGEELKRARAVGRLARSEKWDRLSLLREATRDARGLLVYQEQVMSLFRAMGFEWPVVAKIRKAMAKSQGRGGMERFEEEFLTRGLAAGHSAEDLAETWDALVGCGAYLFNKSHAVAYALISCWCSYLKRWHPGAFYAAALDHARDQEDGKTLIREARAAGLEVVTFDASASQLGWSVHKRYLTGSWDDVPPRIVGGWTCLPGVGEKRAEDLQRRLREGRLTDTQRALIEGPTIYDEEDDGLDQLREQARAATIARFKQLRGGVFAGRLVEAKCLDWTSPKMTKRHGPPKPGRERSWVLKLADELDELEVRVSGKLVAELEPQVKELVVGRPCVLLASWFDKDNRYYLKGVL